MSDVQDVERGGEWEGSEEGVGLSGRVRRRDAGEEVDRVILVHPGRGLSFVR